MDPNETLRQLVAAIYEGDSDTAADLAEALRDWLRKNGFVPTNVTRLGERTGFTIYG